MNERIESLLPTPVRKQGQQIEADSEVNVFCDMYCKEQMIEFAELIVRECATLAFDSPNGILEHFGVEE
jgi:hypothetical protein